MSFVVRHRKRAREELNACAKRLGPAFLPSVERWLQDLADEAERGEESMSADATDFLTQLGAEGENLIPKTGLDRWLAAGCRDKILAFLAWLKNWLLSWPPGEKPPWDFRMAMQVFMVPNTVSGKPQESPGVVLVLYEVDRVKGRVVVTKYPNSLAAPRRQTILRYEPRIGLPSRERAERPGYRRRSGKISGWTRIVLQIT
jgi:hypothetical protein